MGEITRVADGIPVTRHYEGNWSVGTPGCVQLHNMHALQTARVLEEQLGVPRDQARQAVADIMTEARRTPVGV